MCSACGTNHRTSYSPFQVALLIISTTAATDNSVDKTGPGVSLLLAAHDVYTLIDTVLVPDDILSIQTRVLGWSNQGVDLILTAGGTGFSPDDVTPEAIRPLLAKEASGLTQAMLHASLNITPMAALARPVSGLTASNSLVVTLPGSPKGATENLQAILPILPHALKLARGQNSRQLHSQEGPSVPSSSAAHLNNHPHSHSGHHAPQPKTHDPSKGATSRHRASPYPIIPMQEALDLIFKFTTVLPEEEVPVADFNFLRGHILAEDVEASFNIPSTHTTNVDGYAVRASYSPGVYSVVPSASALLAAGQELPAGQICRVNTGGPVPQGADAVVMVEDTELASKTDDGREERQVKILAGAQPGENIRKPGSDVRKGDVVLTKGQLLSETGGEIGTLCFVGRQKVKVVRRPKVALLSTGNEITDVHATNIPKGVIFDTNRPALQTALVSAGYAVTDLGIAKDEVDATVSKLKEGADSADVIIATGGTSMGELDLLKPVIERHLSGTIHFGRVAMKPGKPTTFATFEHRGRTKFVFSLPGNPASALVCHNLFVLPCLRRMSGYPEAHWELPRVKASIAQRLRLDAQRPEFHRVHVVPIAQPPYLQVRSTGGQRSSKASSMAVANGLACLPVGTKADDAYEEGSLVDVVLLSGL